MFKLLNHRHGLHPVKGVANALWAAEHQRGIFKEDAGDEEDGRGADEDEDGDRWGGEGMLHNNL